MVRLPLYFLLTPLHLSLTLSTYEKCHREERTGKRRVMKNILFRMLREAAQPVLTPSEVCVTTSHHQNHSCHFYPTLSMPPAISSSCSAHALSSQRFVFLLSFIIDFVYSLLYNLFAFFRRGSKFQDLPLRMLQNN